ncbi:MAG TPA: glycosyltransferase [Flavobacteriia bacterium]|nr:glycosyltransferase [Flavobacteriia bacterium]
MSVISVVILILYCVLIVAFIIGFDKVEHFHLKTIRPKTTFSVVIPFRDEAEQLPGLLDSLSKLNYPKGLFEIVFVDDDSEDNSVKIIEKYFDKLSIPFKVVKNNRKTNSPKKDAVETAVNQAHFDWILTTDADCTVAENWLLAFDTFIQQHKPALIAAPVTFKSVSSLFEKFQLIDLWSLQGATIGGFGIKRPFLCNGANLCYKKQSFLAIHGFEGNEHIASGDDIFLLEKMAMHYPDKVHFLKIDKAIITTHAETTLKKLISQRIRWAAKATSYKNAFSKLVSLAVFGMNLLFLLLLLGSIFRFISWQFFILFFTIKFCIDGILLYKTALFFKQQHILKHYLWSSFVYPIFIIFIALASFGFGYSWKGRRYQQ